MQQPNPFIITLLCIGGAALLVFLFWLNHVLRTGGKREEKKAAQVPPLISLGVSYLLGGAGPVNDFGDSAPSPPLSQDMVRTAELRQLSVDTAPPIPKPVSVSSSNTATFDLSAIPSDLTYEEVVTILAGQMTPEGKPKYSGKKIYSWVGGNYNEFITLMKQLRVKDSEPADAPLATTPIADRPTQARFVGDKAPEQTSPAPHRRPV